MKNWLTTGIIVLLVVIIIFYMTSTKGSANRFISFLGDHNLPRGIRNNNPFNLVRTSDAWKGKIPHEFSSDPRFEQYKEFRWGVRAGIKDIRGDIREGTDTIRKLIEEFAPRNENDTTAYQHAVADTTGFGIDTILTTNKATLLALSRAIVAHENRGFHLTDEQFEDAWAIL